MNTEPKVVSTQTTISSTVVTAEMKPVQAHTPDHKMYVTEMRKELSEASTATPPWPPGHNGHLLVRSGNVKLIEKQSSTYLQPSQDRDDYQAAANLTKFNTHINSASMTLSNSELNNICPHGKGSTKSE